MFSGSDFEQLLMIFLQSSLNLSYSDLDLSSVLVVSGVKLQYRLVVHHLSLEAGGLLSSTLL